MEVVLLTILPVDDQINTVLIYQVFILLFHKSHNNINLLYARLVKLPDKAFHKRLPVDFYKPFGNLAVNGNHAQSVSRCQDNGVLGLFLLYLFQGLVCPCIVFVQISLAHQRCQRLIDFAQ